MLDPHSLFLGQVLGRAVGQADTGKLNGLLREIRTKLETRQNQAALYAEASFNERAVLLPTLPGQGRAGTDGKGKLRAY